MKLPFLAIFAATALFGTNVQANAAQGILDSPSTAHIEIINRSQHAMHITAFYKNFAGAMKQSINFCVEAHADVTRVVKDEYLDHIRTIATNKGCSHPILLERDDAFVYYRVNGRTAGLLRMYVYEDAPGKFRFQAQTFHLD